MESRHFSLISARVISAMDNWIHIRLERTRCIFKSHSDGHSWYFPRTLERPCLGLAKVMGSQSFLFLAQGFFLLLKLLFLSSLPGSVPPIPSGCLEDWLPTMHHSILIRSFSCLSSLTTSQRVTAWRSFWPSLSSDGRDIPYTTLR